MRTLIAVVFISLTLACGSEEAADRPLDAESRRARDSVLGESALPGAGGVKGALKAADSAAARRALADSLAREP